jgi:hypothetical protein
MPVSKTMRKTTKRTPFATKTQSAARIDCGICDDCNGLMIFLQNAAGEIFADAHLADIANAKGLAADMLAAIAEIEVNELADIALPASTIH